MILRRKRSLLTAVLLSLFTPSSEATTGSIGNPIIQDVELVVLVKRKATVDKSPMITSSTNRELYGSYDDALSEYYTNDKDTPIIDDILGSSSTSSSRSKASPSSYKGKESSSSYEANSSGSSTTTSKTKTSSASSIGSSSDYYGSGYSYGSSTSSFSSPYKKSSWEKDSSSSSKKKKSKHTFGGFFNRPHHEWNFHPRPIHYIFGSFFTFFFFFGGATFFTAFQVLERPQGCFATSCRRSIQCYKCAFQLCNKGVTYFLWGRDEHWEGFESVDTDFEDEENIPTLRAGIGRALEREHHRSMKDILSRKTTKPLGFEMT